MMILSLAKGILCYDLRAGDCYLIAELLYSYYLLFINYSDYLYIYIYMLWYTSNIDKKKPKI